MRKEVPSGMTMRLLPIYGVKSTKKHFLGASIGTLKILKLAYYRNYFIESNQILHIDKDYRYQIQCSLLFTGDPITCKLTTNPSWGRPLF